MTPETPATGLRIAVVGAGAVGGYYGAMLARAGHDVGFVARGAHGEAIRGKGLTIRRFDGDFTVKAAATPNPAELGPVDLVLLAVKNYDNDTALPLLRPLVGSGTIVLTLQNGVDSPDEAAAVVGRDAVLGGAAYIATAIAEPGVIEQTGSYQRIAFGEVFAARAPDFGSRRANRAGPRRCRHRSAAGRGWTRAAVGEVHLSRGDVRDDRRGAPAARRRAWRSGDPPPAVRGHSRSRGRGTRGRRARRRGHRRSAARRSSTGCRRRCDRRC